MSLALLTSVPSHLYLKNWYCQIVYYGTVVSWFTPCISTFLYHAIPAAKLFLMVMITTVSEVIWTTYLLLLILTLYIPSKGLIHTCILQTCVCINLTLLSHCLLHTIGISASVLECRTLDLVILQTWDCLFKTFRQTLLYLGTGLSTRPQVLIPLLSYIFNTIIKNIK